MLYCNEMGSVSTGMIKQPAFRKAPAINELFKICKIITKEQAKAF